ncbi:MAG: RNA-guided endonuclease InsQ/TnpB family protein, partial [Methanosarcinales archaeon]
EDYYYEMNLPYQINVNVPTLRKKKKVLGVDLGIKKFAVLTVVQDYKHSQPVFIKNDILGKLKRLRDQMSGIQKNLSRIKKEGNHQEFKNLHAYYRRAQNKFRALNKQIGHEVSKFIVSYALANNCDTIAFENLKGRSNNKYNRDLNWLISNWIKGKIIEFTKYKAKIKGIRVEKVNKNYTSRVCSKCGILGKTYNNSYLKEENKAGGHFYCSKCGYSADRDYNASLNIGRLCLSGQKDIRKVPKVVTYMATTSLANRSVKAYSELEKVLKPIRDKSWVVSVSPVRYVDKCTKLS